MSVNMSVDRAASTLVDVPRGLAGVAVTDTALGDVRGREGRQLGESRFNILV